MKTADYWMKLWAKQPDGPTPLATTVKTENLQIALDDARAEGLRKAQEACAGMPYAVAAISAIDRKEGMTSE